MAKRKPTFSPDFQLYTPVLYYLILLGEVKNSVEIVFKTVWNKLLGYMADISANLIVM